MMDRYFEVRMLVKDESLRIKDIVKQTGYDKGHVSRLRKASQIDKLIADAVAAEREACASLLDAAVENFTSISLQVNDEDGIIMEHANTCSFLAAAIRARGNT